MSINFHANQYEQAFTPNKTQNWEVPKNHEGKYPKAQTGFTRIKANDRGHLLPNVPRERTSPWGTFVGTWDMPNKIPGNSVTVGMGRSEQATMNGYKQKEDGDVVISGALKRCHTVEPLPVKMDAPDPAEPMGMVCEPVDSMAALYGTTAPCPQVETVRDMSNQPRATSRKASQEGLKWPLAKSPACHSPTGHPQSPKPVTPMAVADLDVQEDAKQRVSPLAEKNNNAVTGGLKTPDADLQNRADKVPTPADRITGMKSPTDLPTDGSCPQAAMVS